PPEPPTLRGRMGAVLVQAVRRALFWYTGQIRIFHRLVAEAAREQITGLRDLAMRQQRQQALLPDVLRRLDESEKRLGQLEQERQRSLIAFTEQITHLEAQIREVRDARIGEIDAGLADIRHALEAEGREVRREMLRDRTHVVQQEFRLKMLLREIRKGAS